MAADLSPECDAENYALVLLRCGVIKQYDEGQMFAAPIVPVRDEPVSLVLPDDWRARLERAGLSRTHTVAAARLHWFTEGPPGYANPMGAAGAAVLPYSVVCDFVQHDSPDLDLDGANKILLDLERAEIAVTNFFRDKNEISARFHNPPRITVN